MQKPGVGQIWPMGCRVPPPAWWVRKTLEGVNKGIELERGVRQPEKERCSRQMGKHEQKQGSSDGIYHRS